jgi:diadenosine tetraphosphate (Ap4A) HIT family hydrolase
MCPLCNPIDEDIIFQNALFRVILVDDIPGYVRVITQKHVKELSELSINEAITITKALIAIEEKIIELLKPDKINIASLGNMVAHLHFHIIPRYKNDPWWPNVTFCEEKEYQNPLFEKNRFKQELKECLKNFSS